jgi:hypothetical protein
MAKCQYGRCQNEATSKGFILVREGDKDIPINVVACDKHKNKDGFFEVFKEVMNSEGV